LVDIVGRKDAVGKPFLYGTTDEFLKRFDLQTLEDLPDYDELIERIKVLHMEEKSDALYGSTEIIPEEELADSKAKKMEEEKIAEENKVNAVEETSEEPTAKKEMVENIDQNEEIVKEVLLSNDNSNEDAIIDNFKDDDVL